MLWPGVSTPSYTAEQLAALDAKNVEYNGKLYSQYEISQMRRGLERRERAAKRRYLAEDAAGLDTGRAAAQLKNARQKLSKFVADTSGKVDEARTSVPGFGFAEGKAAEIADRQAGIDKISDNDILKENQQNRAENTASAKATESKIKTGSLLFTDNAHSSMVRDERIIAGNSYETAIFYSKDGVRMWSKKGTHDEVSFTQKEIRSMNGGVLTHNHPSGTVFSPEDLYEYKNFKLSEMRACNKSGSYVLRRSDADELAFKKYTTLSLESVRKEYWETMKKYDSIYANRAAQEGRPFLAYIKQAEEDGMRAFCQKYGMEFVWEEA